MNIERGDTFIVQHRLHRGNHFTCVGVKDDYFYAGDTNGRMWKFKPLSSDPSKIRTYVERGETWDRKATFYRESVVEGI